MLKKILKTCAVIMCAVIFISASATPVSAATYGMNPSSQSSGASGKGGEGNPFGSVSSGGEQEQSSGMVMSTGDIGSKTMVIANQVKYKFIYVINLTYSSIIHVFS